MPQATHIELCLWHSVILFDNYFFSAVLFSAWYLISASLEFVSDFAHFLNACGFDISSNQMCRHRQQFNESNSVNHKSRVTRPHFEIHIWNTRLHRIFIRHVENDNRKSVKILLSISRPDATEMKCSTVKPNWRWKNIHDVSGRISCTPQQDDHSTMFLNEILSIWKHFSLRSSEIVVRFHYFVCMKMIKRI